MSNKDYVYDLNHLEANFKLNSSGLEALIIKIDDSQIYDSYLLENGSDWIYNSQVCLQELNDDYTPLPDAKPRKWVTLKTVNGEDVQCEWIAKHTMDGQPIMLVQCYNKRLFISIHSDGAVFCADRISDYTPIPDPQPTPLDMVNELITLAAKSGMMERKLKALKARMEAQDE